jgi:hypothetical protein
MEKHSVTQVERLVWLIKAYGMVINDFLNIINGSLLSRRETTTVVIQYESLM